MNDGDGKANGERAALPFSGALGLDRAAVQLHEVFDDGQPQAQGPRGPRGRGIRLAEALEHMRQELRL